MKAYLLAARFLLAVAEASTCASKKPNILFIMTDDQDKRMGSTNYQPVLQKEIYAKGVEFPNHFVTTAQCCPSRTSLMRGQMAHQTNVTHVNAPGGNYDKFIASGENEDYLSHWLQSAGYNTNHLGKFLNGFNTANYKEMPQGWDFIDALLDPYINSFNTVVMSKDGGTPVHYPGWHQTDVLRAKLMDRLSYLTDQDQPWFLQFTPVAPHVEEAVHLSIPPSRFMGMFPNATVPRTPNYNPPDHIQHQKSSWIKSLPSLNSTERSFGDLQYQNRVENLQGVDEVVHDAIDLLAQKGVLNNTYVIYTADNGYHICTHRAGSGKALPYGEDTNVPFAVRGPGIPSGQISNVPSTHIDLAPTFLDIARYPRSKWPTFLDGRSLLSEWQSPGRAAAGEGTGIGRELINVEFWGLAISESKFSAVWPNVTYKSLRVVGGGAQEQQSWFYLVWCDNEAELYDTAADPYETHNLINSTTTPAVRRLLTRLNAILMVTKSCSGDACRNPWIHLTGSNSTSTSNSTGGGSISSLVEAMDPRHDAYFSSFAAVGFGECMQYQADWNEGPYHPPSSVSLGRRWRRPTDGYLTSNDTVRAVAANAQYAGSWAQRSASLADVARDAVVLNDSMIAVGVGWAPAPQVPAGCAGCVEPTVPW
ncbi:arylsulfatase [Xylariaceae sp. FL0804]|nr:arylsulfatase [Xylariaceae sp. FL0804]